MSPTSSTTLAPTNQVTDDNNEPTIPVSSSGGNSSTTSSMVTTETVAAAMVGVASSIIACALFMYASDLRDWYCHGNNNKWWSKESQRHHHDDVLVDVDGSSNCSQSPSAKRFPLEEAESKTSAGSTHEESDYWVQVTSHELVEYQPQNILPPLHEERDENYNNLALTFLPADDDDDDASISRVSSMTAASYLEGGFSFVDLEETFSSHDAAKVSSFSGNVTVLSDAHRVSEYTPLSSLIKGDGGDDDGFDRRSGTASLLLGKKGANVKVHQTQDTTTTTTTPPLASLDDCSLDTTFVQDDRVKSNDNTGEEVSGEKIIDERDELTLLEQLIDDVPSDERSIGTPTTHAADAHESVQDDRVKSNYDTDDVSGDKIMDERDELSLLEQLIANIPFDEMSIGTQTDADTHEESEERISRDVFVREVCFVPCTADEGKVSLGLEFYNATNDYHPTVQKVDLSGPLVGRVFIGDAILAVNDKDTVGLAPEEILELCESRDSLSEQHATKMTKLTVMSSVADGGSLSDGQQSVDFDSAIEI